MVQLVITILGIALMMGAAIMAVHYGVESYDDKNNAARSAVILAQFQKINSAYHAYNRDHKKPLAVSIEPLLTGGYLIIKPIPPAMGDFVPNDNSYVLDHINGTPYITADAGILAADNDVRLTVCAKFNALLQITAANLSNDFGWAGLPNIQGAARPPHSGCYFDRSDNRITFYYALQN